MDWAWRIHLGAAEPEQSERNDRDEWDLQRNGNREWVFVSGGDDRGDGER